MKKHCNSWSRNIRAGCCATILLLGAGVWGQVAPNDDCGNPTYLCGSGTYPFDNSVSSTSVYGQNTTIAACNHPVFGSGIDGDLFYCWTADCNGLAVISTCGQTTLDTKIAFYAQTSPNVCACPAVNPPPDALCCMDDSCGVQTQFACEVECGHQYMIQLGTNPGTGIGSGTFTITCQGAPCPCEEACCLPDGSCQMMNPMQCVAVGGQPLGPGSSCLPNEACCLPFFQCQDMEPNCCAARGGTPGGPGTACSGPEECCFANGNNQIQDPVCCLAAGGNPQGPGTGQVSLAPTACCLPDGSCQFINPYCCDDIGGTDMGPGTDCSDNDGDGRADICPPGNPNCTPPPPGLLTCPPTICQIPGEECKPIEWVYDPVTNLVRVTKCDCINPDECYLVAPLIHPLNPSCQGLVCPTAGVACSLNQIVNTATGEITYNCCDDQPPACEPLLPPQFGCPQTVCDIPGEICKPTKVRFDPSTQQVTVEECDCRNPDECYLDYNGALPPTCAGLVCPTGFSCNLTQTVDPLTGAIVWDCCETPQPTCDPLPPPQFGCPQAPCQNPGEICKPTKMGFDPQSGQVTVLECDCRGADECYLDIQAALPPMCQGLACPSGLPCQLSETVDALSGFITWDCCQSPPPPCTPTPGVFGCPPTICPDPNDVCRPTELIYDPRTGWTTVTKCDCTSSTECYIEFEEPGVYFCVGGACPSGLPCQTHVEINSDGSKTYTCCKPPPAPCEPLLKPEFGCPPTLCLNPGDICKPTKIEFEPRTGRYRVVECDCRNVDECFVDFSNPAVPPTCGGVVCPGTTQACQLSTRVDQYTGVVTWECCNPPPPPVCEPLPDESGCTQVNCPFTGQQCRPTVYGYDEATGQVKVFACDCVANNHCYVTFGPGGFSCNPGLCPYPLSCRLTPGDANDDGVPDVFSCGCLLPCNDPTGCHDSTTCSCDRCVSTGACVYESIEFGNTDCEGNPTYGDLDDLLCVLQGYAEGFAACPNGDLDPPCVGDMVVGLEDLILMLEAFTGYDPCDCEP
ncbi:MAG: hypothetical protein AABZ47_03940 [Planctomycetota bacterium]